MNGTRKWLQVAGFLYFASGLFLTAVSFVPGALDGLDRLVLPDASTPTAITAFYAAIGGGLTAGLGVIIAGVASAKTTGRAEMARVVSYGVLTWFVVDSLGSIGHGAWRNVIGNVVVLALGLPPALLLGWSRARALDGSAESPAE